MTKPVVLPLSREDEFAAIRDEWNRLAAATDPGSFFLSHEWCWAAWQWRKLDSTLFVLAVEHGEAILGMLPLVRHTAESALGLTAVVLESLAVPDSQQTGLICAKSDAAEVAAAIAQFLANSPSDWDVLRLDYLRRDEHTSALHSELRRVFTRVERSPADVCLCVPLGETWKEYYGRRSRRLKKGNNLISNHMRRDFASISIERTDNRGDLTKFAARAAQVMDLSARSWKSATGTTLDQPGPAAWWKGLCSSTEGTGKVAIWTLELDGVLAAAELQLDHLGVVASLRADVNPDFEAYSPGTYLSWKILELLHGTGRELYNMGPGRNAYKERWSESIIALERTTCFSPSPRGWLIWCWSKYVTTGLRLIRQRLTAIWARFARMPEMAAPGSAGSGK